VKEDERSNKTEWLQTLRRCASSGSRCGEARTPRRTQSDH
jgi:hypothetical protein